MNTDLSNMLTEKWLCDCPSGLLVLQDGKVCWANDLLLQWVGMKTANVLGLSPSDSTHAHLQALLVSEPTILLNTGTGEELWLQRQTNRLPGPGDSQIELHWFSDISAERRAAQQLQLMRSKVDELDLTDQLTGLANHRSLGNALVAQVTRSRRYHNPLSLIMVRMETPVQETPIPDETVLGISRFLRDRLRWADVIGRYTQTQFMLILPETEYADAARLAATIRNEVGSVELPPPHEQGHPRLLVGAAQWHKGQDTERLITAVLQQMDD